MQQAYNTPVMRSLPTQSSLKTIYMPNHPEAAIDSRLIGADNFNRVFGGSHICGGCGTCGGYQSYLNPLPKRLTGGRKPRK